MRFRSPICAQYTGPFILASYNGQTEIGYMDDAISGGVLENSEEVARLRANGGACVEVAVATRDGDRKSR